MDFVYKQSVIVRRSQSELFSFFANPENLNLLTPPWLNFQFLTPLPVDMRAGAKLSYKIRLYMIPLRWESEIVVWNPPNDFTDVQRKGPYRHWIHTHHFIEQNGDNKFINYFNDKRNIINTLQITPWIMEIY